MKPVLLLVDDNDEILEFLEHELSERYSIIKALNGQEALDILKENAVQLVISDIMMPVMDGMYYKNNSTIILLIERILAKSS